MALSRSDGSTVRRLVVAGALGLVAGVATAWAYYTPGLRVFAHGFVIWVGLMVAVSARRPPRQAVIVASSLLMAGVLSFNVGKDVGYGLRYPGSEYRMDVAIVVLWCLLAAVCGVVLGAAFARIGTAGWPAAAATSLAVGLLFADTFESFRAADGVVLVVVAVLALAVVVVVADRALGQWRRVGVLLVPAAAVGYLVVRTPDLLEATVHSLV